MTAMLEVSDLTVRYGAVTAVDSVCLSVAEGELVGLIGPNGAGKTSAIDAISGFLRPSGSVSLNGRSLAGMRPHERSRLGLVRTFQSVQLFEGTSVRENIELGVTLGRLRARGGAMTLARRVDELLDEFELAACADQPAESISSGGQKLVMIARALASNPKVILLDEPAAGLDAVESAGLGRRLRELADGGTALLLVEHDMNLVFSICDRLEVMDFGRVIASGSPSAILEDPAVIAAYLGAPVPGTGT